MGHHSFWSVLGKVFISLVNTSYIYNFMGNRAQLVRVVGSALSAKIFKTNCALVCGRLYGLLQVYCEDVEKAV